MQEMKDSWVRPLGWEDPLEEEMATHSSILPGKSNGQRKPGGLQSMRLQRVGHSLSTEQKQMKLGRRGAGGGGITVFGNFDLNMNLSQIPK